MSDSAAKRRRGFVWALVSAVTGALFIIPWKLANEVGNPVHSVLILLVLAATMNTLTIGGQVVSGRTRLRVSRTDLLAAAVLASFTLFGNLASARAIQDLSPAVMNVLMRAEVIVVAVLGWAMLRERVEGRFWIGAALAMIGLVVLQGRLPEGGLVAYFGSGAGMALVAVGCFSTMAVLTRHFIARIEPITVNALRLWFGVALWFPFHAGEGFEQVSGEQVLYAGLAALAGPFLGRLAIMLSARDLEVRVTALVNLLTPPLTLVAGLLLLSDWPEGYELLGGAIMLLGVAIPLLGRR